jgi:hypothetical protein
MAGAEEKAGDERSWARKIDELREEGKEVWFAAFALKMKGLLTLHEVAQLCDAHNEVFRRAGLKHSGDEPNDAMTHGVYRDAIYQFRAMLDRQYPNLVAEFNEKAPPRSTRP